MNRKAKEKIEDILSALPHIEPPDDFDLRVKSRIASRKSSVDRPLSLFWAKLALPALAALALAVVFFGGLDRQTDRRSGSISSVEVSPAVSEPEERDLAADQNETRTLPEVKRNSGHASKVEDPAPAVARRDGLKRLLTPDVGAQKISSTPKPAAIDGGSFEEAGRAGNRILPRGFEIADDARPDEEAEPEAGYIEVSDLLKMIGINASRSNAGWHADSVREGSIAEKNGARPGDIIIAVDANDIRSVLRLKGRHDVSSITVERGGNTIKLRLAPH
jgi:hypothetical protein